MDDREFDRIAEQELEHLQRALDDFDPDEVEATLASGVLTLVFGDGARVVVNSHRAAREIWLADGRAEVRRAYHFAPAEEAGGWRWRTASEELRATLSQILVEKLGRKVAL